MTIPQRSYFPNRVILKPEQFECAAEGIIEIVCQYQEAPVSMASEVSRRREVIMLRKLCWHFMRKYIPFVTLNQLAKVFGMADHTIVIFNLTGLQNWIDTDPAVRELVDAIDAQLQQEAMKIRAYLESEGYKLK